MRLLPPIPPSDPKDWTGWWRPLVAPDVLVMAATLAWATFVADGTRTVLSLATLAQAWLFGALPFALGGSLVGIVAGGAVLATRFDEEPQLERGVLLQDWPPDVLHDIVHRMMDPFSAGLVACVVASLVGGALTGHCPRPLRDQVRRQRLDQSQRRRIARGAPPLYVPGDTLWGVRYDHVPIERPDDPAAPWLSPREPGRRDGGQTP